MKRLTVGGSRLWLVGMALMTMAAASCAGGRSSAKPATQGASAPKQGGTLRVGITGPLGTLNKFSGPAGIYPAFTVIFPSLVQVDPKTLDFRPDFATRWDTSPDGLTWTFQTRPDAKWSDGHPLTADDVAFTLNTVVEFQKGPTANYANTVAHLKNAETSGPNTVILHYDQPVANVLTQVQSLGILPQHVWGPMATGDGSGLRSFANTPAGQPAAVYGGPFVVTDFKKDDVLLFQKNPNYYGEKPLIDGFGIKAYANADAMVSALKSGEIDAISGVPTTAVDSLKSAGFTVSARPGLFRTDLLFNSSADKAKNRELLDPTLKAALEYAVDRNTIVKVVSNGLAEPGGAIVPPAAGKWHDAKIQPSSFDIAKANQLLDAAGYRRGADGVRQVDGRPMSYEVILQPELDRAFQIVQSDFDQVGVKLTARPLDSAAAFAAEKGPDNRYADFDMAISAGGGTPQIDPDFMLSGFICATRGVYNTTGYCNPAFDQLYEQQSATAEPQRVDLVQRMQELLYTDKPSIVLSYNNAVDAWSTKWTGIQPGPRGLFGQIWPDTLVHAYRTS